jgi:hypothetical protein
MLDRPEFAAVARLTRHPPIGGLADPTGPTPAVAAWSIRRADPFDEIKRAEHRGQQDHRSAVGTGSLRRGLDPGAVHSGRCPLKAGTGRRLRVRSWISSS